MSDIVEKLRATADDTDAVENASVAYLLEEAAAAIGKLREERRWIPVAESLPPLMTEVLGWHPSDRVRAWFRHSGTVQGGPCEGTYWESWAPQDRECDDCGVDEPTHWMNLPQPPEVISPKLTPESVALLREQWDALHKGPPPSPPEVK